MQDGLVGAGMKKYKQDIIILTGVSDRTGEAREKGHSCHVPADDCQDQLFSQLTG